MPLQPSRTVAELKELRELTGDESGAQRVAWTETWERARGWLREKVAGHRSRGGDRRGGQPVVHAPRRVRARGADRRAHRLGAERRLARRRLNVVAGVGGAAAHRRGRERRPVTVRLVNWADEEGARFGRSLFGSSAAAGSMADQDELRALTDADGVSLPDALAAARRRPRPRARRAARSSKTRGRLPRAPHRAGPGARVARPPARRRARHVRRRAPPDHLARPGGARGLDARWPSAATRSPAPRSSRSRSGEIAARGG